MFVTSAYAQAAGGTAPGSLLGILMPFIIIFVIMYFLIIRPQRQRVRQHEEMIAAIRRGDTVITAGGIIGKVTKVVSDEEIQIELAEGMRVRVVRSMINSVRAKGEPVKGESTKAESAKDGG